MHGRGGSGVRWRLFQDLAPAEVELLLSVGHRRRFARREVIWHQGDRADTVHFIRSGRIGIQAMTSMGEVATVAVLGSGEGAGLISVHGADPYHTTGAVALEPTLTTAVRLDDLAEIRRRLPVVNDALVRYLADRVLDLTLQLVDALYVPADTRILRRLATLAKLYDRGEGNIVIPLTQEDLAGLAGVTRPTVNRVLKKEEHRGILLLSRGAITVLDPARLATRAI